MWANLDGTVVGRVASREPVQEKGDKLLFIYWCASRAWAIYTRMLAYNVKRGAAALADPSFPPFSSSSGGLMAGEANLKPFAISSQNRHWPRCMPT
jgi:hypothetical protein